MKRLLLVSLLALLAPFLVLAPAAAKPPAEQEGASGKFSLTVHTHSSEFRGPGGAPLLRATDPLSFEMTEGESFSYASVECESPAPFNDVALDFSPDYPGLDDPLPVRHVVEGTIVSIDESGQTGEVEGTITTFLCENGEETDQIVFEFEGTFTRTSDNQVRFSGTFTIEGGTGRFADITGEGKITGEFTCLPRILENEGASSCADLGVFSDFIAQLSGTFADPTT